MNINDEVHYELLNWSRWCWMGAYPHPLPRTQCGSLEGDYRAPPEWSADTADAPEPPKIRPNERRAKQVHDVWVTLHDRPRLVLKAEYPSRYESGRSDGRYPAAMRLNISLRDYETALGYAVSRVQQALSA